MTFTALFLSGFAWAESAHLNRPFPNPPIAPLQRAPSLARQALPAEIISQVTNAPNPFDSRQGGLEGKTQISYRLAHDYPVQVTIYDLLGRPVRRWEFQPGQEGGLSGSNSLLWDGSNETGQKVAKGGYLAQIEVEAGGAVATALRKIGVIH